MPIARRRNPAVHAGRLYTQQRDELAKSGDIHDTNTIRVYLSFEYSYGLF